MLRKSLLYTMLAASLYQASCVRTPSPSEIVDASAATLRDFDDRFTTWFMERSMVVSTMEGEDLDAAIAELEAIDSRYRTAVQNAYRLIVAARIAIHRHEPVPADLDAAFREVLDIVQEATGGQ